MAGVRWPQDAINFASTISGCARNCASGAGRCGDLECRDPPPGEIFMDVTIEGMQTLGGYGYTREAPMQRHFRAARGCTITGGSSEMQRQTIARRLSPRRR
jgi:hypothetical protein